MALAGRADRLFDGLLRLLPQEFRDRHGREIVQVFRAERAEAATRRGRAIVWLHTAVGLLQTAPVEHLSILKQDVRFAARGLARHPVFALAATLTLAVPIGATTAMFGLLNTLVFQPLPFGDLDRTVIVDEIDTGPDGASRRLRASPATFDALYARGDLFEDIAAHRRRSFTLAGPGGAESIAAAVVSRGWSRLVSARPAFGRLFTDQEEADHGRTRVAILSQRAYDAHAVRDRTGPGARVILDGEAFRVVGVMPDSYRYPYGAEIWIPGTFPADARDLLVVARIRPEISFEAINRELAAEGARLAAREPVTRGATGVGAARIRKTLLAGADRTAWLLLIGVALVLSIACANIVHLLFVRMAARQREFCIRTALGANRSRQVRQMVTETIVLFAIAAAVGLLAAPFVSRSVYLLVPHVLRAQFGVRAIELDASVALFVGCITLGLALVFGFAAAAQAPPVQVTSVLKDDLPASPGGRARRLTRIAMVGQVSLALVLVSCAVFLVKAYDQRRSRSLGLDPAAVLTFQLDLISPAHREAGPRVRAITDAVRTVQGLPGVVSAAVSSVNPLCCYEWGAYLVAQSAPAGTPVGRFAAHHREVTSEFFNVLGVRLKRGRAFTDSDVADAEQVAIVDQRVVDHLWPGRDPIGQRVRMAYENREHPWRTVVGVAEAVHDNGAFDGTWYVPVAQHGAENSLDRVHLIIKTTGDPLALAAPVRHALSRLHPPLAPFQVTTMEAQHADALSRDRLSAFVLSAFAVFGLLLASIGIYGVTANAIERRLPELGIRMAFGACPAAIVRSAADRALRLSAAGCVVGVIAAFLAGAMLQGAIFSASAAEPQAIAAAAALVACASLAACIIPAWRAAATMPRAALQRWE